MATGGEESTRPYLLVPRTKSPCYETSAFIRQLRWPLFIFPFHCVFYEFVFRLEPFLEQTRRVHLMAVDGLAPEAPSHRTMAAVIRTNVTRLKGSSWRMMIDGYIHHQEPHIDESAALVDQWESFTRRS